MRANENPFRSSAIAEIRFRISAKQQRLLLNHLRIENWHGCILGPHGTGKSVLLEDLGRALEEERVEVVRAFLNSSSTEIERKDAVDRAGSLRAGQVCLIDGGEALGRFHWLRLIRRARRNGSGLVATVHRPCGLPVLHTTAPNLSLALDLAARLAGDGWNDALAAVAEGAFHQNGGNMREVFRACYWHCAGRGK